MSIEITKTQYLESFTSNNDRSKRRIFITGASGSGKSSLWKQLRAKLSEHVDFPVRLISRPVRQDDDLSENRHLPIDLFELWFNEKSIEFFWPKFLPERTEYYGFEFNENGTVIYGCNNEFLLNVAHLKSHSNLFEKSLIIHITCDIEIRKMRLSERYINQKISPGEINYRVDSGKGERDLINSSHIIVQNNSTNLLQTTNNLINLLALS